MPVSVVMPDAERDAKARYRLTIMNRYDDAEKCFLRIVTFDQHVYITKEKSDAKEPYLTHPFGKSFVMQVAEDFPNVPKERWKILNYLISQAHDYHTFQEAENTFFDILQAYGYLSDNDN